MRSKYLQEDLKILADYLNMNGFAGSTLLVTGATGLLGSLCLKSVYEYNKRYAPIIQAIAFCRSSEKVKSVFEDELNSNGGVDNIQFVYQDICDPIPETLSCDYIIHTANSTTSKYFMTNPVEVIDSIYTGTKCVLDFALSKKVKGVVYLSSMEVFGRVDCSDRIGEDELGYLDIHNIRSCYSEGKRLAELICKAYAEEYGVPVRTARLSQTFGAGIPKTENRVFAQFARSAVKGGNIVMHTMGQSFGNYCYTRDTLKAIFLLLKNGGSGDSYTIVNEETTRSIAEMAQMVAEEFSKGMSKVVFDIPEGNEYGYAPDTKMQLSSKKMESLGWKPEVPLKEMYERMIPDLF